MESATSAKSSVKAGKRAAKAIGSTSARELRKGRRVSKHAGTVLQRLSGRTKRFVKSHPVRVLVGASAIGLVLAKLGRLV